MPSRETLIATAVSYARELGWRDVLAEDMGKRVMLLLGAPGACEQEVTAPLSQLRRTLTDWGGPELYPATEEYDLLVQPDEENLLDLRLEAARSQMEPITEPVLTPVGEMHNHRPELEPTLKDLYREIEHGNRHNPDGVPYPDLYLEEPVVEPAKEVLVARGKIVARRAGEVKRFGYRIDADVYAAMQKDGWAFTQIVKAENVVAVTQEGLYVEAGDGRKAKRDGTDFVVTHAESGLSFTAQTLQVGLFESKGWTVS